MEYSNPTRQPCSWYDGSNYGQTVISSQYDFEPSDSRQYQTHSPASDQSSYDQVPSLGTSSNNSISDTYCEDSFPLSNSFFTTPTTPIQDLDFDLSGSGGFLLAQPSPMSPPSPLSPPSAVFNPQPDSLICPHGCKRRKPFGRTYELKRHMKEQHRCLHDYCKDVLFKDPTEKKDHEEQHHGRELGFRCGVCELKGLCPRPFQRGAKLKKHFKDEHGVDLDIWYFHCTHESCYLSRTCGGIFFITQDELNEHNGLFHSPLDFVVNEHSSTSRQPADMSHSVNFGKRHGDHGPGFDAKRSKNQGNDTILLPPTVIDNVPSAVEPNSIRTQVIIQPSATTNISDKRDSIASISSRALPHSSEPLEEIIPVSVIELHAATRHSEWNLVLGKLAQCNLKPTFVGKLEVIKLRGHCTEDDMKRGRMILTELINEAKPSVFPNEDTDKPSESKLPTSFNQECRCPGPIEAMDPEQDKDIIVAWNERFLPDLLRMVKGAKIEGSCSASLVRLDTGNGKHPIVRFQSSGNQGKESRKLFQESVNEFCFKNQLEDLTVQFTEGKMVQLMAGQSSLSVTNDPPTNWKFPHPRRYWRETGMSGSIGPAGCPHVSATVGGYISVDGQLLMLSVAHFLTICRRCPPALRITSPSISDLHSVKRQVGEKLKDIQLRIARSGPTDEIPLESVKETLFSGEDGQELIEYQRIEREAEAGEIGFATLQVQNDQPLRLSTTPHPIQGFVHHRMDWSLSAVDGSRQGQNRHRHPRKFEPSVEDLSLEKVNKHGTGVICTKHEDVEGGEDVFYVGTTSGLREGKVNKALVAYVNERGQQSQECSIIVPGCENSKDSDFQGDSGAWIMRQDNSLIGLLWGWVNGNLLFTPIVDVFADITALIGCRRIKLPEYSHPQAPGMCARTSCSSTRDNSPERKVQSAEVPDLSPVTISLHGISGSKVRRRQSSGASSTCSLPSLQSSSSSSDSEDIGPETPPLQTFDMKLPMRMKTDPLPIRSLPKTFEWEFIRHEEAIMDTETSMVLVREPIAA
ncbi:hypothetical protein P154DRAFT_581574 [Amniculicola lignicola CBS 123094]|uniref:C2H2-type domain-containing protein n=1 Tax=Amniculicola lignicola CBS 123094 TaxID=1392246 RepID=A0A6A5VZ65_9PLEO|nr:hypothetical protein P154DRAFT_581574 [Amniculicola lignicola CBS 123094]